MKNDEHCFRSVMSLTEELQLIDSTHGNVTSAPITLSTFPASNVVSCHFSDLT